MIQQLVAEYFRDAIRNYNDCASVLGVEICSPRDLLALSRAGRSGLVARSGEVTSPSGNRIAYRIHGSGYSFTSLPSGAQLRFDVSSHAGTQCLRFTAWDVQQYAAGLGNTIALEAIGEALAVFGEAHNQLYHVTEHGFDYYCYPVSVE